MQDLPATGTLATTKRQLYQCPIGQRALLFIRYQETANSTAAVFLTVVPGAGGKEVNLIYPGKSMAAQELLVTSNGGYAIEIGPGNQLQGYASSGAVDYAITGRTVPA